MNSRTTLADLLKNVFIQLDQAIPAQNNGETVFGCWSKILGGGSRTEYEVLTSMSEILIAISKLEQQGLASRRLDQFLKNTA